MIYRVRHVTRYEYGAPVDLAAHVLHLAPRTLSANGASGQIVRSSSLVIDPVPVRRVDGTDYFGNPVSRVFHETPHRIFEIRAESEVEVCFPLPPPGRETLSCAALAALAAAGSDMTCGPPGESNGDRHVAEFLFDSPFCPATQEARAFAAPSFAPDRPILDALLDLNARMFTHFRFRAGVTTLSTSVPEVLARGEGVCQDFTHVMISALRAHGVPARYVSGYIRTRPPPGQTKRLGADQSHAWVGAWLGPDHGWVGLDPTNGIVMGDEHVILGWGRDYGDVSPVRGLILGGGGDRLSVSVDLEPL